MKTIIDKQAEAAVTLQKEFGYKNIMSVPKITKVVISSATGTGMKKDRHYVFISKFFL